MISDPQHFALNNYSSNIEYSQYTTVFSSAQSLRLCHLRITIV